MKLKTMVAAALCCCMLAGCVSERAKREYVEWQKSDDAVASVGVGEFESKYMDGWRDRAQAKRVKRLAHEEYWQWRVSDDAVKDVSFEEFQSKYRTGWRERAEAKKKIRLVREAKKRAIARRKAAAAELRRKRNERIEEIASADLKTIRAKYADGDKFICPYPRYKGKEELRNRQELEDWLKTWTEPRLDLSEEDKLAGEALLSEFGTKYLPNAYANYEKRKDAAAELQQVFNEEFPEPWAIKETDPKWNAFNKVLEKLAKARTESFLCHDELCRYWLMWRLGVMTEAELAETDAQPLAVALLAENVHRVGYELVKAVPMEGKIADFAAKYAPESSAVYQKLEREFKELDALLKEVFRQHLQMDDVRFSRVLAADVAKRNEIVREMNTLSKDLQAWHMDHRTTEKTSEDVAKCDHAMALRLKPFVASLPGYIKDKGCGRVIPASDMVAIPNGTIGRQEERDKIEYGYNKKGKRKIIKKERVKEIVPHKIENVRIQRTEVTQLQWMTVMGNNPSRFEGPDRPVENVSWDDCQEFIRRVSAIDGVQYRLPTEDEWEYACRAGSTGDWGKRKNGEVGLLEVMGWHSGNSRGGTHPVAQREPNAWGLFDMHGNVWEWCADLYQSGGSSRVYRGGSWRNDADRCAAGYRDYDNPDYRRDYPGHRCGNFGFRLVSPAL